MRWVATDRLALFVRCLAGVTREAEGEGSPGPFLVAAREFGEGVELRVDERVHRVDDEGEGPGLVRVAGGEVDDRDEVAEALPGTGAGGDHHAAGSLDGADRLHLVGVEADRLAVGSPEDLGGRRVEHALGSEVVDGRVAAVGGESWTSGSGQRCCSSRRRRWISAWMRGSRAMTKARMKSW